MRATLKNKNRRIALVALILIIVYSTLFMIFFPGAPSYFGDDTMYDGTAYSIVNGAFSAANNPFALNVPIILPIAIAYYMFGVSIATSVVWDELSFLLTIIITFLIGRELFNSTAGIISALIIATFPVLQNLSETANNVPIMVFFTSFSILATIYATRRNSRGWLIISGAAITLSVLSTPESAITALFLIVYILFYMQRRSQLMRAVLFLVIGISLIALPDCIFNLKYAGNPLAIVYSYYNFSGIFGTKNLAIEESAPVLEYVNGMFGLSVPNGASLPLPFLALNSDNYGIIFYFVLASAIYLLAIRERKSYFMLSLATFTFLYLQFGPMKISFSPFTYIYVFKSMRFLTLLAVPSSVIFGIAMSKILGSRRNMHYRYLLVSVLLMVLLANLVYSDIIQYFALYSSTHSQIKIAGYLETLSPNTRIFLSLGGVNTIIYMKFQNQSRFDLYSNLSNCSKFPSGSYVIVQRYVNSTFIKQACPNMTLELAPNISKLYYSSTVLSQSYY